MANVNKVILIGNVTRDPEVKFTSKGSAVTDIGLAINRNYTLDNGEKRKLDISVGDTVLFGKYAGTEVKVDGEELLVMREEDIMAVIE